MRDEDERHHDSIGDKFMDVRSMDILIVAAAGRVAVHVLSIKLPPQPSQPGIQTPLNISPTEHIHTCDVKFLYIGCLENCHLASSNFKLGMLVIVAKWIEVNSVFRGLEFCWWWHMEKICGQK